MIHVAASQYAIELLPNWETFEQKVTGVIEAAKQQGAQLLMLPEYSGVEIYERYEETDRALFERLQAVLLRYIELFQALAKKYQLYIQPGTILVRDQGEHFYNRAYFFGPDGHYGFQDKLQIVADEKENDVLARGTQQTLFETTFGLIGVAICYDSEFPETVRNFTKQGVKLILVPSFTPSKESFLRVYYSCQARAIENQCYIVVSSAVGQCRIGDTDYTLEGQATIFSPIDIGFATGVIAQGKKNNTELVHAILEFEKLDHVRKNGQVHNFFDFLRSSSSDEKKACLFQKI